MAVGTPPPMCVLGWGNSMWARVNDSGVVGVVGVMYPVWRCTQAPDPAGLEPGSPGGLVWGREYQRRACRRCWGRPGGRVGSVAGRL